MIKQFIRSIVTKSSITLALFLLIGTISAAAQSRNAEQVTIQIPFQFSVGDERLPAGTYTIKRTSQAELAYVIQNKESHQTTTTMVKNKLQEGRMPSKTKLVFDVYEGKHFLSQIWTGADNTGSELNLARARREVAHGITERQTVTLIAAN